MGNCPHSNNSMFLRHHESSLRIKRYAKSLGIMVILLAFCGSCFAQSIEDQMYYQQERAAQYRYEQRQEERLRLMREQTYYMQRQEQRQRQQEHDQFFDGVRSLYD